MKNTGSVHLSHAVRKSTERFGLATLFMLCASVRAATVYYDPPAGDPHVTWDSTSAWSDGNAASSGHDYIVDPDQAQHTTEPQLLTDQTNNDSAFPGDSLVIQNGGELATRWGDRTITISDLTVDNGAIAHAWKTATHTLAGNLQVGSGGMTVWNNRDDRAFIFDFLMSGSGAITVRMANRLDTDPTGGTLTLNNSASTWAGDLILDKQTNVDAGAFTVNYALDNSASHLTADGGTWDLQSFTHQFGTAEINGSSLAPGTYDATALNSYGGTTFSGSGSLQIIPEPASFILFSIGGLLALFRRKRRSA